MKKSEKTKRYIIRFVQFFRETIGDYPTQREVATHLEMSERNVQRYYRLENEGANLNVHKYYQTGIRPFKENALEYFHNTERERAYFGQN
jgi:transcriptional regulator GlxA family with amidase domain